MVSESVGRELKITRERRGLLLEDVSSCIHVPVRQLQAIEQDDFSVFPAEVYARGAYMKYAAFLGMDTHQATRAMWRVVSASRQSVPLTLHTPQTWFERLQNPRLILVGMLVCAVSVVGGYIAWQVQSFWRLPILEIVEPKSDVVFDSHIVVRGVSEPDVRIRVNGEAVLLREDSTFDVAFTVRDGVNAVRIEAENAAGRTRVVERYILKPRIEDLNLQ